MVLESELLAMMSTEYRMNLLDDLELIELVDLGGGLAGVLRGAREPEGLGAVEGGVPPDLGRLLGAETLLDSRGGLLGLGSRALLHLVSYCTCLP
jgi:hypothetical protein